MMKPVYITAACAVSPQDSFESDLLLSEVNSSETGKLFVQEPDYTQYINPVAIRRMSRLIKMGIACGMKALKNANVQTPDAIITGTGLGSMTDTERFLKDMITLQEQTLNPTFFIQSTYNSINGWISVQTKSTGYSQTYVNRGFSMEMALMDAQLFLNEASETKHVLAGGFDELTDEYFLVKSKVGYWKKQPTNSLDLLNRKDSTGTIGGEGAAFFVVSNQAEHAICELKGIKMLQEPSSKKIKEEAIQLLKEHQVATTDIDVVICGNDGDSRFESMYSGVDNSIFPNASYVAFKHLTGEYPTATGFGVWLATQIFSKQLIPEATIIKKGNSNTIKNILLVNHYLLNTASLLLLSKT